MNQILNTMIYLLLIVLVIVGIVALIALGRFLWITAKYTYVFKLQKYNENKLKIEREYNVIVANSEQLKLADAAITKSYSEKLVAKDEAERATKKLLEENERLKAENLKLSSDNKLKIAEINEAEAAKKPGRPRKES